MIFVLCLLLLIVLSTAQSQTECNFESHHSHLVIPLAKDVSSCSASNALFFLSHGATFFCPHTYDVKLVGIVVS